MASFGKDPRGNENIVPFGGGTMAQRDAHRKAAQSEARKKKSSGNAPYWKDAFRLPTNSSRIVRFIMGSYDNYYPGEDGTSVDKQTLEYYIYSEHFHGATKRGAICSAGPMYHNRNLREPCLGCNLFWEDAQARGEKKRMGDKSRGPNRMSRHDVYAFNVWDYGLWINVPRMDAQGRPATNSSGQPYCEWTMADANDPRQYQYQSKYGHLIAWPMNEMHKDALFSYMERTITQDCATCGSQGTIVVASVVCAHCGNVVYDPANTTLTKEERDKIITNPYHCPACGGSHHPQEVLSCRVCEQHNQNPQLTHHLVPRRATIFDVDLELTAVSAGDGKLTTLQILNRSNPRPIQVADPAVLESIKPLDLASKYRPTSLEKQSELWGIPLNESEAEVKLPTPQVQMPQQMQTMPGAIPQMQVPQMQLPQMQVPQMYAPQMQLPQAPQMPQAPVPQMQVPQMQAPQFQMPQMAMPQMAMPGMKLPGQQ